MYYCIDFSECLIVNYDLPSKNQPNNMVQLKFLKLKDLITLLLLKGLFPIVVPTLGDRILKILNLI